MMGLQTAVLPRAISLHVYTRTGTERLLWRSLLSQTRSCERCRNFKFFVFRLWTKKKRIAVCSDIPQAPEMHLHSAALHTFVVLLPAPCWACVVLCCVPALLWASVVEARSSADEAVKFCFALVGTSDGGSRRL